MSRTTRTAGAIAAIFAVVLVVLLGVLVALRGSTPPPGRSPSTGHGQASAAPTPAALASTPTASVPAARTVTILAAGDVLLHPSVWRQAADDAAAAGRPGYDFEPLFAGVAPEITAADLALCHLETPVGTSAGPYSGYPRFSVPPHIVTALRRIGFDGCSTASNHTLDAGEAGVYRTLDALDAAGLHHAGSYRSATARRTPTLLDTHGVTVAHLSYAFGFNGIPRPAGKAWIANLIDPEAILTDARRARSAGAEIVVVSLHWGNEYDHRANPDQITLAHRLLAGDEIDLILGSHAHVVQPIEKIHDRWVVYGMGNQIARQSDSQPARHEGVMPSFTLTERAPGRWAVTRIEVIATWIDITPRIRVTHLTKAITAPTTTPERRRAYRAALHRITSYLQLRGAAIAAS